MQTLGKYNDSMERKLFLHWYNLYW